MPRSTGRYPLTKSALAFDKGLLDSAMSESLGAVECIVGMLWLDATSKRGQSVPCRKGAILVWL